MRLVGAVLVMGIGVGGGDERAACKVEWLYADEKFLTVRHNVLG